jgi:hypothetical protein
VQKCAGKVLASIFCNQDSFLFIDYFPKGQTINVEHYSSLLVHLKDVLKEKCCGTVTKGFLFLLDNAPAHHALATQKKLAYLDFQYIYIYILTCSIPLCVVNSSNKLIQSNTTIYSDTSANEVNLFQNHIR